MDNTRRQRQDTGGVKDNLGKPRVDLIPMRTLLEIGKVLDYGARQYAPHNWRLGLRYGDTMGSIMRHLIAFNEGEDDDPESGISHLAHAATQLLYLMEFRMTGTGIDDRWSSSDHEEAKL